MSQILVGLYSFQRLSCEKCSRRSGFHEVGGRVWLPWKKIMQTDLSGLNSTSTRRAYRSHSRIMVTKPALVGANSTMSSAYAKTLATHAPTRHPTLNVRRQHNIESIYTLNRSGDRIPPCRTPFAIVKFSDIWPSHLTHIVWDWYQHNNSFRYGKGTPRSARMLNSLFKN